VQEEAMMYAELWTVLFGVLFAGYLVLAGIDYGVGIALPFVARDDAERRSALRAVGPFVLGNEAWMLVSVGALVGTLPGLQARLLAGTYPMALTAVGGALVFLVAVHLRSRRPARRLADVLDVMVTAGCAAAAYGWGAVLTAMTAGITLDDHGQVRDAAGALSPVAALGGLTLVVLVVRHGSTFLQSRSDGVVAARAARLARAATPVAGALLLALGLSVWLTAPQAFERPPVAVVFGLLALIAVAVRGPVASGAAIGILPLTAVAAKAPHLLTPTDPRAVTPALTALAADPTVLALVTWTVTPLLALVLAAQAYTWWTFRDPARIPAYY
jgi:cytochrome bd ubiquinol oxidase subunit II